MTIKEIRQLTGLNKMDFAEKYKIPYRSLQNWEYEPDNYNHRICPEYVLELLEFKVKYDYGIKD